MHHNIYSYTTTTTARKDNIVICLIPGEGHGGQSGDGNKRILPYGPNIPTDAVDDKNNR